MTSSSKKIFGQDAGILAALMANFVSWLVRTLAPSLLPYLLPPISQEDRELTAQHVTPPRAAASAASSSLDRTRCIVVGRPGGVEQLRCITLKADIVTCGYNIAGHDHLFVHLPLPTSQADDLLRSTYADCVVIRNGAFSVNYADCAIRWGLYESANQKVGYPIVPGFDVAGIVERVGAQVQQQGLLAVGDRVVGCSLFGAYSTRILIPANQLRKIPAGWSLAQAASIPAVALTSLYSLTLAGYYPPGPSTVQHKFSNKSILIHSAAGGVGSMLVQMSKLLGLSPIVGVVGRSNKVEAAQQLGCDVVIDKSRESDLWAAIRRACPQHEGTYAAIMDANGVETLQHSFDHLAMAGRLIVFGFHTNLPLGKDSLTPLEWINMGMRKSRMPKFDPMELVNQSKSVLAFNLSFFANEKEISSDLIDQVMKWIESGQLQCPRVVEMDMSRIQEAHDLIQSGTTIGKLILTTPYASAETAALS